MTLVNSHLSARVCIVAAFRDVAPFVQSYRKMVERWTYQPSRIVIGENDSADETLAALEAWPGITLFSFKTGVPLFPKEATARRAAHLALVRNCVIEYALEFGDWSHALMSDAQKYVPPSVLALLVADGRDIVQPLICIPGGCYYDSWCSRHLDGRVFDTVDDGRPLGVLDKGGLIEVGAVGGVYLVRRDVLEAGCRLAGTDGRDCDSVPFCTQARARGFKVWVDQRGVVVHCPEAKMHEQYVAMGEVDP